MKYQINLINELNKVVIIETNSYDDCEKRIKQITKEFGERLLAEIKETNWSENITITKIFIN